MTAAETPTPLEVGQRVGYQRTLNGWRDEYGVGVVTGASPTRVAVQTSSRSLSVVCTWRHGAWQKVKDGFTILAVDDPRVVDTLRRTAVNRALDLYREPVKALDYTKPETIEAAADALRAAADRLREIAAEAKQANP